MGNKKIIRDRLIFEELTWDTNYFGIPSAKFIVNNPIDLNDLEFIRELAGNYQFNTIQNIGNNADNNRMLADLHGAFITDINIQYEKSLSPFVISPDDKIQIGSDYHNNDIKDISQDAFVFSRFFNDPFLNRDKARQIYVKWVESAFNRPEKFFVVYHEQGKTGGFLLFNFDWVESLSTIELIAVHKDFGGRGIGSKLIKGLEGYLTQNQINKLKVGTQVDNLKAMAFYQRSGFQLVKANSVFHYWPGRKVAMV